MHEEQKHKRDMLARHEQEQADAQRAFAMEQEQHRMMWDLKVLCPYRSGHSSSHGSGRGANATAAFGREWTRHTLATAHGPNDTRDG